MARDPNGIALQSVDPDLSVQYGVDSGAGDLMDWASSVVQFGEDATEVLASGGGGYSQPAPAPCAPRRRLAFHPAKRMTTPFTVAGVVAVLIIVIVLFPTKGGG